MARLHLLRHAKAAEFSPGRTDHQRPLTERGHAQAAALGEYLRDSGIRIDQVLCSTATRTRETLAGLGLGAPVEFSDAVYQASPDELLAEIAAMPPGSLLVIGHAPGIPGLAHQLAGPGSDPTALEAIDGRYPTATLATLDTDADWAGLDSARLTGVRIG